VPDVTAQPTTGTTSDAPVAVVTGASRGLGFLIARELAEHGHRLVICARNADGLQAAADQLRAAGADVTTVVGDVSTQPVADRLVEAAVEAYGRLDVLVNNAGIIQVGPVVSMTTDDFADAMNGIFWGTARPTLAALPVLRRQGSGRIVNVTSIGGRVPAPHLMPYVAAKFATVGFSETLRAEAGKYGITVTTVVPGLMRTGSPLNALFKGDTAAEYRWFAAGDSIPLVSIAAPRAARRIVRAGLRGRSVLTLTPAAVVASRLHGLAPGLTGTLAAVFDRTLPRGDSAALATPGHVVERESPPGRAYRLLTGLSRRAAAAFHQHDDRIPPGRQTAG
jgi:NAD(P)-dependent dehydrogenase (short-subunit alcohol dehydrogenase family)